MARNNRDAKILEQYSTGIDLKKQYLAADWTTKAYILKNLKRLKNMLQDFDNFK